ncbi:MAG TPA: glutathione transferase GstA [Xanthobacteraceae bacterium]|nr:glutathione transferase GstA [Xanthobacteraceae bacterium]
MKLYYAPGACSLSPHIVAREAGVAVDLERVDNRKKQTASGEDYWQINPKGQVPALRLDDGEILTEGPVIVQYIADQAPGSGLVPPAGSRERYRVLEWLNFVTSELHKNFTPLFRPNTPDDYKPIARENLAGRCDFIERHLAGRQYLVGEAFTAADAYLFTVLRWSALQHIDLSRWPNISAYMTRIAARPKVKEAMQAEGLLKAT